MYEYLIYSRLKKYAKTRKSYHMPGHKGRGDFKSKFPAACFDVTELSYSDNLHSPSGVIAAAQRDIAEILGAKASYITTDGSSSGVFAMVYCAAQRGGKIVVARNSHRSVWNACAMLGVEPLVVQGKESENILLPPDPAEIESLFANDASVAGLLVTSPDYYGNVAPLETYAAIAKKYGRLFFVDGAHGAHLAFGDRSLYAGTYADMWVDGAHKTLPVLTQGAVVSVNEPSLITLAEEALGIFRTTSPSYPIMASVEYGVKYLANHPEAVKKARTAVDVFAEELPLPLRRGQDWAKLAVDFKPLGISADEAAARLEKEGVYAELSDGRYVLFYLSPAVRAEDLKFLKRVLLSVIKGKNIKGTYRERPSYPAQERTYSFGYALKKPCEYVPLEEAAGRMCARNAGIAPPCIPVAVAGEIVTPAAIAALSEATCTFGLNEGKICVVKRG